MRFDQACEMKDECTYSPRTSLYVVRGIVMTPGSTT